jgi:acetyl-CoA acetyltransferase
MRHGYRWDDIDAVEINEAFAAQVLGCLAAWESDAYCKEHFGSIAPSASSTARSSMSRRRDRRRPPDRRLGARGRCISSRS